MSGQSFDAVVNAQSSLCMQVGAEYVPSDAESNLGIASNAMNGSLPMHGLRHFPTGDTCGWYIWSGDYSDDADFFKPMHVTHALAEPSIFAKYLGLAPGWRFLIGENGYEDVWFDESLLLRDD